MKNAKLIPKHQIGKKILKFFESFGNALIAGESGVGASMAIASGYLYNPKTRKWELSEENLKKAEGLRNNLSVISTFSPTHPGTALIDKAVVPAASYITSKYVSPIFKNILNKVPKRTTYTEILPSGKEVKHVLYIQPKTSKHTLKLKELQPGVFGIKSLKYLPKEHVTTYQGNPKLLNDWLYSITDDIKKISKNTENLFKRFTIGVTNNYQNHILKKIPVSSEFKAYLNPTLQRLLPSLRSYIENMVPNVYLEIDNLLTGKNSLGYWDGRYIKLRKTVPKNYSKASVFGHEARHAIDDKVLNVLTNDQNNLINDAYNWDNLDLVPNYKSINTEKVTTNVDSRNLLFDSYHDKNIRNYPVDQQNQIIDSYSDQAIVNFVQNSNGYGHRYIDYLKNNNKLTPEKINKFREAMKYVPILGGLTFLNQNNQ